MDPVTPPGDRTNSLHALSAHAAFVRRIARAMVRGDAEADDIAQDTLLLGLTRAPTAERARASWLATVARRIASRWRRTSARRTRREARVARSEDTRSTLDAAARAETVRAVGEAVAALDLESREVVILRHYDGLPPRRIAERLQLPVETVKQRLRRAHLRLRSSLSDVGTEVRERRRRAFAALAAAGTSEADVEAPPDGVLARPGFPRWPIGLAAGVTAALMAGGLSLWGARPETDGSRSPDLTDRRGRSDFGPGRAAPELAAAPTASRPAPLRTPVGADGAEDVIVGELALRVPRTWSRTPRPPGEGMWLIHDGTSSSGDATRDFAVLRRVEIEYALSQSELVARGARRVGGRAATWYVGRTSLVSGPGEFLLVVLDDGAGSAPVFRSLVEAPDSVAAHRDELDRVLDSVRFEGRPGDVEGIELTEADIGRMSVPVGEGTTEVLVMTGDRPCDRATVSFLAPNASEPWATVVTGPNGLASAPHGLGGAAEVVVRATDASLRQWRGEPATFRSRRVCPLGRRRVQGTAYARDGTPLVRGSVRLTARFGVRWDAVTETDDRGAYVLDGLVAGDYRITAHTAGATPESRPEREEALSLSGPIDPVHADLGASEPDADCSIRLRWQSGTPAREGSMLYLERESSPSIVRRLVVGPDGRARALLPPGGWRAQIGLHGAHVVVDSAHPDTALLLAGVVIAGRVAGLPAGTAAEIECRAVNAGSQTRTTYTDPTGAFFLEGVDPGPHRLRVRARERSSDARLVEVPADRDVVDLELERP